MRIGSSYVPTIPIAAVSRTLKLFDSTPTSPTLLEMAAVVQAAKQAYRGAMTTALYNRDILRLAASIPNAGRLERPQATVEKRSPVCGSRITVDVALDAEGRVAALGQEVRACALGQASASLMGASAAGRSEGELAEARDALAAYLAGERDDPGTWPGLDIFRDARPFTARHRSILLPFEAVAEAVAEARR